MTSMILILMARLTGRAVHFCPLLPNFKDLDILERLKLLSDWKDLQNEMINDVIDDMTSFNPEYSVNEDTDTEDTTDMIELHGPP